MSFKSSSISLLVLCFSLLLVSCFASSSSSTTTTATTSVHEWDSWEEKGEKLVLPYYHKIKDVKNNKKVQAIGTFVVHLVNRKHSKNVHPLVFSGVTKGEMADFAGDYYYNLTVSTIENKVTKMFVTNVTIPKNAAISPAKVVSFEPISSTRKGVTMGRPGGIMEIKDVKHNKEAQEKGRFAVREYNDKHQNGTPLTCLEVVKGQYQVVAGLKYYLTISATQNGVKKLFYAVVLSPATPYNAPDELISFTPLPSSSPPLLGKPVVIKDIKHNKRVQVLGKFAVDEYNGRRKNKTPLKFVEVVRGEYQVVAGLKYTLDISVIKGGVKDSASATVLVKPGPSAEKELISFFMKIHKQN